jgi:hypothetical protein
MAWVTSTPTPSGSVTGSYDAESFLELGDTFMFGAGDGSSRTCRAPLLTAERLARSSHALTVALPDLDLDGRRDILVGNDFNVQDAAWRWTGDGFEITFDTTTEDTMSLARVTSTTTDWSCSRRI